MMLIGYFKM